MDEEQLYISCLKSLKQGKFIDNISTLLSRQDTVNKTEYVLKLIKVITKILENEDYKKYTKPKNIVDATIACCKNLLFTSKEIAYVDKYLMIMLTIFNYLKKEEETSLIFELSNYMNLFEAPIMETSSSIVVRYYKYITFIRTILSKHFDCSVFKNITKSSRKWVKLYGNSNKVYQAVDNILPHFYAITAGKDNDSLKYFMDSMLQCLSQVTRNFTNTDFNNCIDHIMDLLLHFFYGETELKYETYVNTFISSLTGRIQIPELKIVTEVIHSLSQNPNDIDSDSLKAQNNDLKVLNTSNNIIKYHCLCTIYKCIKFYIQKKFQTETPPNIKADIVTQLSKLLYTIADIFKQTSALRLQCSDCKLENDLHNALNSLALIRPLCANALKIKNSNSSQILEVLIDSYKERFDLIMRLHNEHCPAVVLYWNQLYTEHYNTFVAHSSSNKNPHYDIKGTELLIRNYNTIKEHITESKQFHQCAQQAYTVIFNHFESINDERALLAGLLKVIEANFSTQSCKSYVNFKFKLKDFYNITWYDLLKKYNDCYEMNVSNIDYEDLCLKEAEMYNSHWRNPDALFAVCKVGFSISKDPIFHAKLIVLGQVNKMNNPEFNKMVVAVQKSFEVILPSAENKFIYDILLGSLYYLQYLIEINILIEENRSKKTPLLKKENPDILNERLEDDTCIVIHINEFVNIIQEEDILNHLKKSYKLWHNSCHNIEKDNQIYKEIVVKTIENIEIAAKSFSLHNYQIDEIKMWKLMYNICKTLNNHLYLINAASHLIKMAGSKCADVDSTIDYCNTIAADLLNTTDAKDKQYIFNFWLSIAHYNYKCNEIKLGLLKLAYVDSKLKNNENYNNLLASRLQWLKAMFMSARSMKSIDPNQVESNISSYCESYNLITKALTISWSTSNQLTLKGQLLETTINLARVFLRLCIHRPAYQYLKTAVEYAKRYAVAKRMAEILSLLAHTDLLTENVEDCQFKLDELKGILGLENIAGPQIDCSQTSDKYGNQINLSPSPQSSMIDISPATKYQGSPSLGKIKYKMPDFIHHVDNCSCLYCCSPQYHMLVLETLHVEAQLNTLNCNYETARHYFNGCDNLYEFFIKKIQHIKDDLLISTQNRLSVIYARSQYDYALLLRINNKKESAHRLIKRILKLHDALLVEDIEFLQQVLSLESAFTFVFPKDDESIIDDAKENYLNPSSANLMLCLKTPNQPIRSKIINQIEKSSTFLDFKDLPTPDIVSHLKVKPFSDLDNIESKTPKRKFFKTPRTTIRVENKVIPPIVVISDTGTEKSKSSSSGSESVSNFFTPIGKSCTKLSNEVFYTPQSNIIDKQITDSTSKKINPSSVRRKALKNTMKLIFEEPDIVENSSSEVFSEIADKVQAISLNDKVPKSKEKGKRTLHYESTQIEKPKREGNPQIMELSSSSDDGATQVKKNLRKTRLRKEPTDRQSTVTTKINKCKQDTGAIATDKVTPAIENNKQNPRSTRTRKKLPRNPFIL